jgi:hypothetical protein
MPERRKESKVNAQGSGSNTPEPFASYDPDTSSWKMLVPSLPEDSTTCSGRWPTSGTMRSGDVSKQPTWVPRTDVTVSGSWPTPNARDWKDTAGQRTTRQNGRSRLDQLPRTVFHVERTPPRGGRLNPQWVSLLMGYPADWL